MRPSRRTPRPPFAQAKALGVVIVVATIQCALAISAVPARVVRGP